MTRMEEWLSQNRNRAYPMDRGRWRKEVSPDSGLDCVLLDAMVFDADAKGDEELTVDQVDVNDQRTRVSMSYGGRGFVISLQGGETIGDNSFEFKRMILHGSGSRGAYMSLVFSSHAYIKSVAGSIVKTPRCRILPSRVVRLVDGFGVDAISVNGSAGVDGHAAAASIGGDVVLEDGYRTSPIIHDGKVLVRVGQRYGLDPCHFRFESSASDCRKPLFYFCGQNGVTSGNVVLKGGKGITVTQGGKYRGIPCVEIVAGKELLDLYHP